MADFAGPSRGAITKRRWPPVLVDALSLRERPNRCGAHEMRAIARGFCPLTTEGSQGLYAQLSMLYD